MKDDKMRERRNKKKKRNLMVLENVREIFSSGLYGKNAATMQQIISYTRPLGTVNRKYEILECS